MSRCKAGPEADCRFLNRSNKGATSRDTSRCISTDGSGLEVGVLLERSDRGATLNSSSRKSDLSFESVSLPFPFSFLDMLYLESDVSR